LGTHYVLPTNNKRSYYIWKKIITL
jgi:hypothetical protein